MEPSGLKPLACCGRMDGIIMRFFGAVPSGYTTIVVLISFLFAVQFFITGIIGEYLIHIFNESKKRPIYIIDRTIGLGAEREGGERG